MFILRVISTKEKTNFIVFKDKFFDGGYSFELHKDDYKSMEPKALRTILDHLVKFINQENDKKFVKELKELNEKENKEN